MSEPRVSVRRASVKRKPASASVDDAMAVDLDAAHAHGRRGARMHYTVEEVRSNREWKPIVSQRMLRRA